MGHGINHWNLHFNKQGHALFQTGLIEINMYPKVEHIYDINISIPSWNRLRGIYDVNNKTLSLIS